MALEEKTRIQGDLIGVSSTKFNEEYYLKLFIKERTTEDCIHVVYQGKNETESSYYQQFYGHFLIGRHPKLNLTINGCLEKEKMEYKGIGLIKCCNI